MTRSIAPPASNAHGAGGALGRALLVLGIALFPLGLTLPLLETARFVVLRETYSVLDTLHALWINDEFGLALLLGVFSVGTPIAKAGLLICLHLSRPGTVKPRTRAFVNALGKWSLTEVVVVAAMIVLWSSDGFSHAASLPGLWIFAGSAACLMLASGRITADLETGGIAPQA